MGQGTRTVVTDLNESTALALERELRSRDYSFRAVAHARFSAQGEGVTCTMYLSGRCVVQGPGAEQFAENHFEEGIKDETEAADPRLRLTGLAVGSDEAGKGDYFGPLVVAAVAFGPEHEGLFEEVRIADSKKMTANAIRASAVAIRRELKWAETVLMPTKYNELYARIGNLNRLLAWAHGAALERLLEDVDPQDVIIDKFCEAEVIEAALKPKTKAKNLILRPRAEQHPAVAAASILATDTFTRRLAGLGRTANLTLPKGAGSPVDAAARRLVKVNGPAILESVAKVHFKTTQKILGT